MKGDFSRRTFDPSKHYADVLMQQGRVQLDADWNEQQAIHRHRAEATATNTIGANGAPKPGTPGGGGFAIGRTPDNRDLTIAPGRIYADGILCELEPTELAVEVLAGNQVTVPFWTVDGRPFAVDQWVQVYAAGAVPPAPIRVSAVDKNTRRLTLAGPPGAGPGAARLRRVPTVGSQPDHFSALPRTGTGALADGRYRVYLDVWERLYTPIQDPAIRETALGGPDTGARSRVVWQVKLEALATGEPRDCAAFGPGWAPKDAAVSGMLRARIHPNGASAGPCVLPPGGGFQGLENQLFRVEVHNPGAAVAAGAPPPPAGSPPPPSFKWQRDNGSVVTALEVVDKVAIVSDVGKDDALGFAINQTVEAGDDRTELDGRPGHLLTINGQVDRATRTVPLSDAPANVDREFHATLRRWDGTGPIRQPANAQDWIPLENGIEVQFAPGTYRTGDFWLIPARTATSAGTGDIEWPRDAAGTPLPSPPHGVRHDYVPLAVVTISGGLFVATPAEPLLDCRRLFPPLTDIEASDVGYANPACAPNVATVKDALDFLCERHPTGIGLCTLVATPGPGWQAILAQVPATPTGRKDARICLPAGDYPLPAPAALTGLGHITLAGIGPGTRILAPTSEAALVFRNCESVTVRDIAVETGVAGAGKSTALRRLNGALTFTDCGEVEVESVTVTCANGTRRAASCIKVASLEDKGAAAKREEVVAAVRIRHSDLRVGEQQTGILLVNVARATIEDNTIRVREGASPTRFFDFLADKVYRRDLARRLVSGITYQKPPPPRTRPLARVQVGTQQLDFETEAPLVSAWQAVANAEKPQGITTAKALQTYLERLVDRVLLGRGAVAGTTAFTTWIEAARLQHRPAAAQGVVVAGIAARDVRILNNTIDGALQGIHVGVSRHDPTRTVRDTVDRLAIKGNTITIALTPTAVQERHGVFVGNCSSLEVLDNLLRVVRVADSRLLIPGIRVFGHLGRMIVIRQNHLMNFSTPVISVAMAAGLPPPTRMWLVDQNLAINE
jgi:hypothetical protein